MPWFWLWRPDHTALENPKQPSVLVYVLNEQRHNEMQRFQGDEQTLSPTFPELNLTINEISRSQMGVSMTNTVALSTNIPFLAGQALPKAGNLSQQDLNILSECAVRGVVGVAIAAHFRQLLIEALPPGQPINPGFF